MYFGFGMIKIHIVLNVYYSNDNRETTKGFFVSFLPEMSQMYF